MQLARSGQHWLLIGLGSSVDEHTCTQPKSASFQLGKPINRKENVMKNKSDPIYDQYKDEKLQGETLADVVRTTIRQEMHP